VVASKRAPVEYGRGPDGALVESVSPGGTASVIADQAAYLGVTWLASALSDTDRELAREKPGGFTVDVRRDTPFMRARGVSEASPAVASEGVIRLRLLVHDDDVFEPVQYHFVNEVLWLAQHGLHDRWSEPDYTARTRAAWDAFVAFNTDYATALVDAADATDASTYLIHDFQLMCAPEMVRAARPDARILSFSHSSWPGPDEWRVVPRYVRTPLIVGALGADVVGFFAERWVRNFLRCVADLVPDSTVDWSRGLVTRGGHTTAVRAMPLGYSPRAIAAHAGDLPAEVATWLGDAPLVLHSGRTDPIKNATRAVDVFARTLLASDAVPRARFAVKMNPNRLYVPANKEYAEETERRADLANKQLGYEAVRVLVSNDVGLTQGLLRRADVVFLNSVTDGMNLTAFEAAMVNTRDCTLLLSENCGAAERLGEVSTVVHPFDLVEQGRALRDALCATPESRAAGHHRLREAARGYTLEAWVRAQVDSLTESRHDH
jgi:trehalose 6-phosphate synthase